MPSTVLRRTINWPKKPFAEAQLMKSHKLSDTCKYRKIACLPEGLKMRQCSGRRPQKDQVPASGCSADWPHFSESGSEFRICRALGQPLAKIKSTNVPCRQEVIREGECMGCHPGVSSSALTLVLGVFLVACGPMRLSQEQGDRPSPSLLRKDSEIQNLGFEDPDYDPQDRQQVLANYDFVDPQQTVAANLLETQSSITTGIKTRSAIQTI